MKKKIKILIISTGGTIAGKNAALRSKPKYLGTKSNHSIASYTSILNKNKYVEIDNEEVCDVDSSNILPLHWKKISNKIYEEYDNFDAFFIAHGTNTLAYTASALSFSFENLGKPIIITGSQVPIGISGSDALTNLENSIRVAIADGIKSIKGVIVVFGSHIISGVKAKKTTEFDYEAFQSFTSSSLGRIGIKININETNLKRHHSYLTKYSTIAHSSNELKVLNSFDTKIASITEFPGMSPGIFKAFVEGDGIKGIILRSFGAGDVSNNLEEGLQYLKEKRIPLVVTTQAPNGVSNFLVNSPGKRLLDNDLAIPSWDMSIESQTTKLSWLLGQSFSYEEIKLKMIEDFRGEINITK